MGWRRAALLVAAVAALTPGVSLGRGQSAEQQRAKKLFDTAMELVDQGKHALACPMLEESLELDAGMGTKYYLARCYEALGKLASAHRLLGEVADEARQAKRPDRERHARSQAAALERRVPHLTVSVPTELAASSGLRISIDGTDVPRGDWGRSLPIDLGEHEVRAKQRGSALAWREKLFLAREGESLTVDVPVLDSLRDAAAAPTGRAPADRGGDGGPGPSGDDPLPADADDGAGFDWLLATGVASAVAAVAAVVLYNYGWAEVAALNSNPDMERYRAAVPSSSDACEAADAGIEPPAGPTAADVRALCDHGRDMETLQAVALPVSIGLSGLALALILTSDTVSSGEGAEAGVALMAGPGTGGLLVRGRF